MGSTNKTKSGCEYTPPVERRPIDTIRKVLPLSYHVGYSTRSQVRAAPLPNPSPAKPPISPSREKKPFSWMAMAKRYRDEILPFIIQAIARLMIERRLDVWKGDKWLLCSSHGEMVTRKAARKVMSGRPLEPILSLPQCSNDQDRVVEVSVLVPRKGGTLGDGKQRKGPCSVSTNYGYRKWLHLTTTENRRGVGSIKVFH